MRLGRTRTLVAAALLLALGTLSLAWQTRQAVDTVGLVALSGH